MVSQGFTPTEIVQAACPEGTLASNYQALTGKTTAWQDFMAAVNALPNGVTGDDPWQSDTGGNNAIRPTSTLTLTFDPVAKTITLPAGYRIISAPSARVAKPFVGRG
jgi:hypothetical protein